MGIENDEFDALELSNYSGKNNLKGFKDFSSGNNIIDRFVTNGNLRAQAKLSSNNVKVLLHSGKDNELVGFYTINAHYLNKNDLKNISQDFAKTNNVPVARLIMLGVSKDYQHKGYGKVLMMSAFEDVKSAAQHIGLLGLFLDAAPDAVDFYLKLGFSLLDDADSSGNSPMFIHLDSIL